MTDQTNPPKFDSAQPYQTAATPYPAPKKTGSAKTVAFGQNGWLYTATGAPIAEGPIPKSKLSRGEVAEAPPADSPADSPEETGN